MSIAHLTSAILLLVLATPSIPSSSAPLWVLSNAVEPSCGGPAGWNDCRGIILKMLFGTLALFVFFWLFGPRLEYKVEYPPDLPPDSVAFVNMLEGLAGSRLQTRNHVQVLPNGEQFYEAELAAMIAADRWGGRHAEAMSAVLAFLWPLTALLVTVQAAGLFAGERSRQTLDVLLTTPLTGREILQQKLAAVRRVIWMMLIPFATAYFIEAAWEYADRQRDAELLYEYYGARRDQDLGPIGYLICSFLNYAIYAPMFAWLAVLVTMRMKSQARAMITAIGALLAWCFGTLMFAAIMFSILRIRERGGAGFAFILLSPVPMIPLVEVGSEFDDLGGTALSIALVNYIWYGGITLGLRAICLANADAWLGRSPTSDDAGAPTLPPREAPPTA